MTHWLDKRGRIRNSADECIFVKALPRRRTGHRGHQGGGGVGRRRRRRRRGLNEASRKEIAWWWDDANWKDGQVDGNCRGSFLGRIAALCFGFSDERWPFLYEYRRKEESKLTFFGKLVEAFHRVSRLFEHLLHEAPQL